MCLDKLKARLGVSSSLDVVDKVDFLCRAQGEGRKAEKLLKKINEILEGGGQGVSVKMNQRVEDREVGWMRREQCG